MPRGFAAARSSAVRRARDRAESRPSDQSSATTTSCPRARSAAIVAAAPRASISTRRGARRARIERAREVVGVEHRRVDRRLQVEPEHRVGEEELERPLVLLVAARRAEREHRPVVAHAPATATASCAAAARRTSDAGSPPRARTSARACRGRTRGPGSRASSAASRRSASPRRGCRSGRRRRGGRCRRASARPRPRAPSRARPDRRQPPVRPPGRSSPDASAPISARRAAAYAAREQRVQRHRRRVAVPRLAVRERELRALDHRVDVLDAEERPSSSSSSSASCCRNTGPWPHGPVLNTVQPRKSQRHRLLDRRREAARRSSPASRNPAGVIASATQPRYHASRAASIRASRVAPADRREPRVRVAPAPGCAAAPPAGRPQRERLPSTPDRSRAIAPRDPRQSPGTRRARSRSRTPARRRAPTSRSRAAAASRRRTRPARTPRSGPVPGHQLQPQRAIRRRSRPRPAPAPARRSPRTAVRPRAAAADRRPARSGAARRPAARSPAATAASNAFPPRSSTAIPAADASQCVEATIPKVPLSSGRVVKAIRPKR